uniref:Alkaline ceramidase n=1 Tax=Alexandrium catenella TaxID=2925 RepID=A0A7S1RC70_ALECA|mmetsp:Transcript_5183/g.13842  ORF Transcript_5183/g.13842 Transcript_5183/m.13842 type:complete len:274 (+) Transcript_5183:40-861(+)
MAGPADAELFWGPIDAAHQFCEAKYGISPYVAEFWNTFSNIPFFIIPGIYALVRGRDVLDWRLRLVWLGMVTVGCGSFLFHLTMRFKCEMLDEVPMLLLVFAGVLTKDDTHWVTSGSWKVLIHAFCIALCSVGMYMYLSLENYEMFLGTFSAMVVLDLGLSLACASRPDGHGSWAARGCLIVYAVAISSGRLLWEVERNFCVPGKDGVLPWMHVAWHFLAGCACYFSILADMHIRWEALGVGNAIDDPVRMWPLVGLLPKGWRRSGDRHRKGA